MLLIGPVENVLKTQKIGGKKHQKNGKKSGKMAKNRKKNPPKKIFSIVRRTLSACGV